MKVLDIAILGLSRSFRKPFNIVMMFLAPILVTGLLYFAFGGIVSSDSGMNLEPIQLEVVNLDQGEGEFSAGAMLMDYLADEELAELLEVVRVDDVAKARDAVDVQQADVALIIPSDFTSAALAGSGPIELSLYQDPTLSIGPAIVKDLVTHFMDGFAGAKIAADVATEQFQRRGIPVETGFAQRVAARYASWLETESHHAEDGGVLDVRPPAGREAVEHEALSLIGPVMASMMIFFVFFMGANASEAIIREDEEGTLARLFVTPTSHAVILGGNFLMVFVTLIIQTLVLLLASTMLFGIQWGKPSTVALMALGLVVEACGFGVLVMCFIKSTRQTGPVLGGVLVLTGMLGGLFTTGVPKIAEVFGRVNLTMPQGWALHGWRLALAGAGVEEVGTTFLVMVGIGLICFLIGVLVFRKRYA